MSGIPATVMLVPALIGLDWNYTLRNVMLGAAILGAVGGAVGCFAVLRRESLMGDTLAHAALPGICLAFLITGTRASFGLMIGAALTGWLGTLCVLAIVRWSRIKQDAALGIVLSVFFGVGTVLLTYIARTGGAGQSGLDRFLFGQAASIVRADVITMAVVGSGVIAILVLFFKEFKLISFDPALAASLGLPTTTLAILLTGLIVVAVVIGLQAVGVILMVAVLIAPALAARQWTNRLETMVVLAAVIGATSGVIGSVLSAQISRLPTGPTIVLVATGFVIISVLFAPERGIVGESVRSLRQRQHFTSQQVLAELWTSTNAHNTDPGLAAASVNLLADRTGKAASGLNRVLRRLGRSGLVERDAQTGAWALTASGRDEARQAVRREQLWRMYLANQLDIPTEGIHLTMDDIERVLPPVVLAGFEESMVRQASAAGMESGSSAATYANQG